MRDQQLAVHQVDVGFNACKPMIERIRKAGGDARNRCARGGMNQRAATALRRAAFSSGPATLAREQAGQKDRSGQSSEEIVIHVRGIKC